MAKRIIVLFCIITTIIPTFAYTRSELEQLIIEQQDQKWAAEDLADAARRLGFPESSSIFTLAKMEWEAHDKLEQEYRKLKEESDKKWGQKYKEYPVATYIWEYLKNEGFNDYVCAGIMGNIMAEVGGQTLDIKPYTREKGYYGICQWYIEYTHIDGGSLKEQCAYLVKTMPYEINTFGFCYRKGFKYNNFVNMTNAEAAAIAFCDAYERCGSTTHAMRRRNARIAYNYFAY